MANIIRRENRDVGRNRGQELDPFRSWDPFRVMDAFLRHDPFRENGWLGRESAAFVPHFDVKETKDAYVIRADLPGVKDDDVEISATGNVLTISGRREEEHREEGERYHTMERSYGQFVRSFSLPDGADPDGVKAQLSEGVLTVHIGKKPEVQPRKISIGKGDNPSKS